MFSGTGVRDIVWSYNYTFPVSISTHSDVDMVTLGERLAFGGALEGETGLVSLIFNIAGVMVSECLINFMEEFVSWTLVWDDM